MRLLANQLTAPTGGLVAAHVASFGCLLLVEV